MKSSLAVSLIQTDLAWQQPEENRRMLAALMAEQIDDSDLTILPEMFPGGFSMDVQKVAESPEGGTLQWMAEQAALTGAVITGSYAVEVQDKVVNRLVWMRPDGSYEHYDKRHLFRMAGEHKRYAAGNQKLVVELQGWRICPMICYDLRFPVWCRNKNDYDLIFFVANWPESRSYPWISLLKARAIENLSYVIGVNRVGVDGNDLSYSGHSMFLDYRGLPIIEAGSKKGVFTSQLNAQELLDFRRKFPADLDADDFSLDH